MPIKYRAGLTDAELISLESAVNFTLPIAYKNFLARMNGFHLTDPDYGQLPLSAVEDGVISFDRLFGVDSEEECNDLISFNNEFISELAFIKGILVIGEDGGGNPYVLVTEASKDGVYYWDRTHLHESDKINIYDIAGQDDCGHLYRIAGDFDEFYSLILTGLPDGVEFLEES
ncbi:SMI1/KNR4 family protein [Pseudomonas sp. LRP2-20]|uniref:SMI1/KNR4 family protein n=1 Tax=Pseudomonas sp. LRP2-20 TaxID=2944234 RepID=UPI00218B6EB4|nr:SMI1/KNR4 family protein [Pseudomonas sp. LRP2-20]BDM22768.1 SMI1/KNR4 family protein [Pseudomonas sp. LRP2-20]